MAKKKKDSKKKEEKEVKGKKIKSDKKDKKKKKKDDQKKLAKSEKKKSSEKSKKKKSGKKKEAKISKIKASPKKLKDKPVKDIKLKSSDNTKTVDQPDSRKKVLVVKKMPQETKVAGNKTSSAYNVKVALEKLRAIKTIATLNKFVQGDERVTIKRAAAAAIKRLSK